MKLYKANIVFTPQAKAFEVIENGYIAVDDQGIIEGVYTSIPEHLKNAELTDFGDKLLIPAMNDLHVHAPQYKNMGLAMDLELLPWLNAYTFPEEERFSSIQYAEEVYRRFVHELWMQGTMRSAVFATIHPGATKLLARLFQDAGMGAYIGLVGMNRNCPDYLSNTTEEVVRDTKQLIDMLQDDTLVRPIITPRFVPSCTDDMQDALGQMAAKYHLPVQSHLSENISEIAWVKELEPTARTYGEAYYQHGLFGQTPTLMAHCCYTKGEELDLMRRQHVYAVHCPTSNCNLASGIAPVRVLMDNDVPVALGTDISGGNNMSVLRIIQYAIQMSKLQYAAAPEGEKPAYLSLSEAFYLATKSGGSFFGKVGSFEKGYEFDALVVDDTYLNYAHYPLLARIERYIYLGDDRDIKVRFCRGQVIKEPAM